MNAQEMLELIERQEKLLRDALAQLGDAKRKLRGMLTVTATAKTYQSQRLVSTETETLDAYRKQGIQ